MTDPRVELGLGPVVTPSWEQLGPQDRKQRKRLMRALRKFGESSAPADPRRIEHLAETFRQFEESSAGDRSSKEAFDQLIATIEASADESDSREAPLLPYRSLGAWIAKGVTKTAWSEIGEVQIDDGMLSLLVNGVPLANCSVSEVSVHRVLIWFGIGVRLDVGAAGRWYVQPRYSPRSIRQARRATRAFRRALAEAQEHSL
jgi:hypothetical protein